MKFLRKHLFLFGFFLTGCLLIAGGVGLVLMEPDWVVPQILKRLPTKDPIQVQSVRWEGEKTLVADQLQVGNWLKVDKVMLSWSWEGIRHHRFNVLRLIRPQVFLNLKETLPDGKGSGTRSGTRSHLPAWTLNLLSIERGELFVSGLGPGVPTLTIPHFRVDWEEVPLFGDLKAEHLEKVRTIVLRQVLIRSPQDYARTLLRFQKINISFTYTGLKEHRLESLIFERPVLELDRGLFWYIDALRNAKEKESGKKVDTGPLWMARHFEITKGELDITPLKQFSLEYPFEFQVVEENFELKNLSLADLKLELNIPQQDIYAEKYQLLFRQIRGKIAFHLHDTSMQKDVGGKPANDLVNTLYVQEIKWKDLSIDNGWVSLVFGSKLIGGTWGGSFADGYVNGGLNAGWTGSEPWQVWGAAADIDAGLITQSFSKEHFDMTGRGQLEFVAGGNGDKLDGKLTLKSLTSGIMEIKSLDALLEKAHRNMEGMKLELAQAFISSLRDYPYQNYDLELTYQKPDATLRLKTESPRGNRDLEIYFNGNPENFTFPTTP